MSQMHLLRSAENKEEVDWTYDKKQEQIEWLQMIQGAPEIGVVGIHTYGTDRDKSWPSQDYMDMSKKLGKPLLIGEIGPTSTDGDKGYRYDKAKEILQKQLDAIVEAQVPLSLFWTYHMDRWQGEDVWDIRQDKDDLALEMIREANQKLKEITQ
jgi:hypothetical protein